MQHQSSATIFLADYYPVFRTEEGRSIDVLREEAGLKHLSSIKDETLAAGKSAYYHSADSMILIPIVGTIITAINETETEIACGELLVVNAGIPLKAYNSYTDHLVNYLLLSINKSNRQEAGITKKVFDLDSSKNELVEVFCKEEIKISLGKLEMRREAIYYSDRRQRSSFCFVVQGSFEIEGRLLHERDALAVWNADSLDIESLGKESILLLIDLAR